MVTLICYKGRYSLKIDNTTISADDLEILGYALGGYGFVNGSNPLSYEVTAKEWAANIRKVYSMDEPRTYRIVKLLERF